MSNILSDLTVEELIDKIIQKLSESEESNKIQLVSDLDHNRILRLSRLKVIADFFSSDLLTNFHDNYLRLRVSNRRLGRREFVQLGVSISEEKRSSRILRWLKWR